jgi:hypothetical protein
LSRPLRRARKILAETPEQRSRERAEHERTMAKARKALARVEARRLLERSQALDAINEKLDEFERLASWVLFGKSRGAR